MFEHDFQGEIRVVWCEDAESFVATGEDMEGFRGMGGSHADAVADLELGIGLEAAALREERRAAGDLKHEPRTHPGA